MPVMKLFTRSACAVLALIVAASCDTAPYHESREFTKQPNATFSSTVKGPSVTEDYPGSSSNTTDWTFFIRLEGNVTSNASNGSNESPITRLEVGISLPSDSEHRHKNGSFRAGENWGACLGIMDLRPYNFSSPGDFPIDEDVDPSCRGLLPDECVDYLEELADEGKFCERENENNDLWLASPCYRDGFPGTTGGTRLSPTTRGILNGLPADRLSVQTSEFNLHHPEFILISPIEAYYRSIMTVKLAFLGFSHGEDLFGARAGNVYLNPKVKGAFRCMKANRFAEGSQNVSDVVQWVEEQEEDDGGSGVRVSAGLALGVGGFAVLMATLA